MHEKLMCIAKLSGDVNILASRLSDQISELKELLREAGGARAIDTSTAGSQLMQDYQ
jgi:spore maturation protein CgeB